MKCQLQSLRTSGRQDVSTSGRQYVSTAAGLTRDLQNLGLIPLEVQGVDLVNLVEAGGPSGHSVTETSYYLAFQIEMPEDEAIKLLVNLFSDQGFKMHQETYKLEVWDGSRGDEKLAANISIGPLDAFMATEGGIGLDFGVDLDKLTLQGHAPFIIVNIVI